MDQSYCNGCFDWVLCSGYSQLSWHTTQWCVAIAVCTIRVDVTTTQWILFPVWFVGCYMTIDLIQRIVMVENFRDVFLSSSILLFMVLLVFSTVAFERYYQLVVPAVVLLGLPKTTRPSGFFALGALHVFFLVLSVARLLSDVR